MQRYPFAITTLYLLDRLAGGIVDLDHNLGDFRPVAIGYALDDVQFAFLRVDLEEVDRVDPFSG